jgi:hypothetical protein
MSDSESATDTTKSAEGGPGSASSQWSLSGPVRPDAKICFVVLPYDDESELVKKVIRPIAHQHNYYVRTTREYPSQGMIEPPIIHYLASADVVIADLRGSDPVVFYQVAIRHGTRLPIVHITDKESKSEHKINLASMRPIVLDIDDTASLNRASENLGVRLYDINRDGGGIDDSPLMHMNIPFHMSPSEYAFGPRRPALKVPGHTGRLEAGDGDMKRQLNDLELLSRRNMDMLERIDTRLRQLESKSGASRPRRARLWGS